MQLNYNNKKNTSDILGYNSDKTLIKHNNTISKNKLIFGENIIVLNKLIYDFELKNKIDLIYIDPPFATNNTFSISNDGRANTVSSQNKGNIAYLDNLKGEIFLEFIRERLILLKELLSPIGSIYLHIDYKIGHYVKIIMDEVFGIENFRNDITRIKCNPKNFSRKAFGNVKDLILFYSKASEIIWNEIKTPYNEQDKLKLFPKKDNNGKRFTTIPLHAPGETQDGNTSKPFKGNLPPVGRHWRSDVMTLEKLDEDGLIEWSKTGNTRKIIYLDEQEGKKIQDIWDFKDPQYPIYPTEKNNNMLDLIIKTSSNENSIILDSFCGSGTTLKAAQLNNRNWIGIDNSELAITKTIEKINSISSNIFNEINYEFYKLT